MSTLNHEEENRYLLFWVGAELYGAPLLNVREVVEYMEPKYMPNMAAHFTGVINIRGTIVGVVDLRKKFAQPIAKNRYTVLLVCDTHNGPIAAVVDKVDSVIPVLESDLDRKPPVVTPVDHSYLIGIAKVKDTLVTLLELQHILNEDKLVKVSA